MSIYLAVAPAQVCQNHSSLCLRFSTTYTCA